VKKFTPQRLGGAVALGFGCGLLLAMVTGNFRAIILFGSIATLFFIFIFNN